MVRWSRPGPGRPERGLVRAAEFVGEPPAQPGTACRPPAESGFSCLEASATLATLRALDRPAILPLHRPDGELFYGVLAAVRGDDVVLALADRVGMLPAERLQQMWWGDFLLLWRPPSAVSGVVGPGSRGPAVTWLERTLSLAGIPGESSPGDASFGSGLAARVKQFQVRSGVHPDGIAGPQTLILLTNALAAPGPRLGDRFAEP